MISYPDQIRKQKFYAEMRYYKTWTFFLSSMFNVTTWCCSPFSEALELVAQLQQQQQSSQNANKMFQIPDGVDFISQDTCQRNSSECCVTGWW